MRPELEFRIHSSPPLSSPSRVRAPPPKCDARTCPWWPYSSSNDFKANTAMVLIVLFCALVFALAFNAAIRYLLRRHTSEPPPSDEDEEAQPKDASCSAADQEASLPTLVFSSGTKLAGVEAECTVCLSEFVQGDEIRVLSMCNHGFHVQCIQKWLASHSSCPTCRGNCFPPPPSSPSSPSTCHQNTAESDLPRAASGMS